MLVCLHTGTIKAAANFIHEQAWHMKDIAYWPGSNHKFVSCGVN
jgi:hypothetical protein